MDFSNWNSEREKLKAEIFQELKLQKDRAGIQRVSGTLEINPKSFGGQGSTLEVGPVTLKVLFPTAPRIFFGQKQSTTDSTFMVVPCVSRFLISEGMVAGFYLTLYALTAPPIGVTRHFLEWSAEGRSSARRKSSIRESWTDSYEHNSLAHLQNTVPDIL